MHSPKPFVSHRSKIPSHGLFLLVLFLSRTCAYAQNTDPTIEFGMKPYGSFEGGAIDSISAVNGNLNLHIPIVSFPQRGEKLHLGFYVKLANGDYQYTPSTVPACSQKPFVCSYGTFDGASGVTVVPDFGLSVTVSGQIPPQRGLGRNHYTRWLNTRGRSNEPGLANK